MKEFNMSKKKTIAELHSTCNSRSPIEDTVNKRWDDIVAGLANQWSLATIAEALRSAGEHVGNEKNTGFTTAVNRVAAQKNVDLKLLKARQSAGVRHAVTPPNGRGNDVDPRLATTDAAHPGGTLAIPFHDGVKPPEPQNTAPPSRDEGAAIIRRSFGDTRFPSDF